ncbi:CynX/NimT family MFS transporter [Rhodococcus xishaensis]|uniref:MFS transporter n=1 Tax=Rhodococcus xishaensis TaxID=2487364 RepID=A0A438B2V8_9NOCA|nr:MFS transporter [Rhodococcus xishaensis]RVW05291.1 MFS transporter [Rhodococcus xishaensis]
MTAAACAPITRGPQPLLKGRVLVFAAIAMSALSLRLAVTSFTPLASQISDDLGFSSTVVGVFGMVPTAMFAVFGLLTPALARRIGHERTALLGMSMAGFGMLTRAMVSDTWSLLALSALALGGMGIGNVVIPPLVKRYFSDRVALMSSIYIAGLQTGTIVPALVAVPLADSFDWRFSMGVWSLLGFAAAAPWLAVLVRDPRTGADAAPKKPTAEPRGPGRAWRSPVGWGMAFMFGTTALITYSMFTWIPEILTVAGASAAFAGTMVGLFAFVGLIAAFVAPNLCARMHNPFPIVVGCAVCYLVGFAGLLIVPMSAPILWVVAIGLGPSTFPMSLTLINLRTRTQAGSTALSGFTQGVGYTIACIGPLMFGVLHESTGGWEVPFALLGLAVGVVLISAWAACKPRMLEDTWGARAS